MENYLELLHKAHINENQLFKQTQKELATFIYKKYKEKDIYIDKDLNNYIFIKGNDPVCFVAHLDTVFKEKPYIINHKFKNEELILSSPSGLGADDRAGVLANLYFLENSNASILFTFNEEKGGIGIKNFIKSDIYLKIKEDINLWIEFDRAGKNDYVTYDFKNNEIFKILDKNNFKFKYGSFSDVAILSKDSNVLGINLSSGYYNQHQITETFKPILLFNNIKKIEQIMNELISEKRICFYDRQNYLFNFKTDYNLFNYKKRYDNDLENELKEEIKNFLEIYYSDNEDIIIELTERIYNKLNGYNLLDYDIDLFLDIYLSIVDLENKNEIIDVDLLNDSIELYQQLPFKNSINEIYHHSLNQNNFEYSL
jgi:hypothetical protein